MVHVSVGSRNSEGYYQLSLIKVERPKDWSALQKAFDEKLTISGVVTAGHQRRTRGGCRRARVHARFALRRARRSRNADAWWARRSPAASSSSIPKKKMLSSIAAW